MQGVIYALNQPAAARGFQSVFFNISTYDKYFFDGIFGTFVFPDMTKPSWESLDKLQREFHKWFRDERTKQLLTFPVVTHAAIASEDGKTWKDQSSRDFIANELAEGGEFFIYTSDTADSLASCCRLKNKITDNEFSYSLGAGGVATGSKNVITINMNRLVQEGHELEDVIDRVQKYQIAFHQHFEKWVNMGLLPAFSAGFITLDKQYLTLGVNGLVEAAEYLGHEITNNDLYKRFLQDTLNTFKVMNKEAKHKYGLMFNTEMVPAENLGVKNAKWDKADGLKVKRDCYNSYFYIVEGDDNWLDRMVLHGSEIVGYLDGGSAYHMNSTSRLSLNQYKILTDTIIRTGCNYFCINVMKTVCEDCNNISVNTEDACPECGSTNISYATRVIGYLKKIRNFSKDRQIEADDRTYS
jgi:ribonucleoside-triphosphate reductase